MDFAWDLALAFALAFALALALALAFSLALALALALAWTWAVGFGFGLCFFFNSAHLQYTMPMPMPHTRQGLYDASSADPKLQKLFAAASGGAKVITGPMAWFMWKGGYWILRQVCSFRPPFCLNSLCIGIYHLLLTFGIWYLRRLPHLAFGICRLAFVHLAFVHLAFGICAFVHLCIWHLYTWHLALVLALTCAEKLLCCVMYVSDRSIDGRLRGETGFCSPCSGSRLGCSVVT